MLERWRRGRVVRSHFGWPVPRVVKAPSLREISILVQSARSSGFSRKGRGLAIREDLRYYLVPYLRESSPESCWMCVVVAVKEPARAAVLERPELHYSRLDVAMGEFERLSDAAGVSRDELLHWVIWDAARKSGEQETPI